MLLYRAKKSVSEIVTPVSRNYLLLSDELFFSRWSFGCLVAEVVSGTKMFSATDKMASVLRPHQLLEMRLGTTEMKYEEAGELTFFNDAKDLINK